MARDLVSEVELARVQSTLQRGDVLLYIRVNEATFEPTTEHEAVYRGSTWAIVNRAEFGQSLYELHLRRIE